MTFYFTMGDTDEGVVLAATVTAPDREAAINLLQRMLYYRLGEAGNCGFNADGGSFYDMKGEVKEISVQIDPEVLCEEHIEDEED